MAGLGDLEDITAPPGQGRAAAASHEHAQVFKRSHNKKDTEERGSTVGYDIPGQQTIYMKTYGCGHNQSDSEYMAGLLAEYGYEVTEDFTHPAISAYLVNSCTVKNPSQQQFVNLIDKCRDSQKPVIVAGCVPQGDQKNTSYDTLSAVGVQQIDRIVEVVEESLRGNTVRFLQRKQGHIPRLDLPKVRRNAFIEVIPINVGCLNNCTYCKTQHARGQLSSYDPTDITKRIEDVIAEGIIEIRLTSEDTGAYGRDIGTDIVELLDACLEVLDRCGNERVMLRLGMTNPPYILEHVKGIARALSHPRVFSFIHIPVQSGSDNVLDVMKREYTVREFSRVCDSLRESVEDLTIATDVICGFPGESEDDWRGTMDLVEQYRFPVLNISQFYPRPNTPAARMRRVDTKIVKARSREVSELFASYMVYDRLVGTTQRVWITEVAHDGKHFAAHNKSFVQVLIDPSEADVGSVVEALITEAGKFFVRGTVVRVVCPPMKASERAKTKARVVRHKASKASPSEQTKDGAERRARTERGGQRTMLPWWAVATAAVVLLCAGCCCDAPDMPGVRGSWVLSLLLALVAVTVGLVWIQKESAERVS